MVNEQKNKIRSKWNNFNNKKMLLVSTEEIDMVANFFFSEFDSLLVEVKEELKGKVEKINKLP